ncbi:hypothetical protein Q428_11225 [Fervidicella metallireducens AeB]|uniref:Uncharacterized protein n=1 Tax=Fervidicella metallireducens AeB TaxID=1403537 RepID=A0A017RTP7_9CLOT|nr:hypothetical protein [Fervidicella metallireducens]EYE87834.1 hypothetical protein Q428_11225 [Fervidicella metallireducens AeB]
MRLLDLIYYKFNKKAVDEGMKYIKRISVKKFTAVYIKRLTYKHDDFKIIKQLPECVDILSWRGNKKYLFRYHKADIIF